MSEYTNRRSEYAKPEDRLQLRELFDSCFPGESGFSRWYFDNVWQSENTLIIRQDGRIISALQMLPMALEHRGEKIRGCYIFAVGTHPDFEGKGCAGALLKASFDEARAQGLDFSALIVQKSSLTDFYSRFGYQPVFKVAHHDITPAAGNGETAALDISHIAELDRVYRQSTDGMLFDLRDTDRWRAQMDAYKVVGRFTDGRLTSYCFYDTRGGMVFAAEACGESADALVAQVAHVEGKTHAQMLTVTRDGGEAIGCLKPLSDRAQALVCAADGYYLNLYYN